MSSLSASDDIAIRIHDVHVTFRANLQRNPPLQNTPVQMGRRTRTVRENQATHGGSVHRHMGPAVGVSGATSAA